MSEIGRMSCKRCDSNNVFFVLDGDYIQCNKCGNVQEFRS